MSKREQHQQTLRGLTDWDVYLLQESGLPGPRANLELIEAAADVGDATRFRHLLAANDEYLILCGLVGLGRLAAEGQSELLDELRGWASDSRWRVREAVVLGLQRVGHADMQRLINAMREWSKGNLLEQRAAAAALCEPPLLTDEAEVMQVLDILDQITEQFSQNSDRKSDAFVALRKGLAYCWSVAVAAAPDEGKRRMERWLVSTDKDVRRVMLENLKKQRLRHMDAKWVAAWQEQQ
jgi:hypothetical protein